MADEIPRAGVMHGGHMFVRLDSQVLREALSLITTLTREPVRWTEADTELRRDHAERVATALREALEAALATSIDPA